MFNVDVTTKCYWYAQSNTKESQIQTQCIVSPTTVNAFFTFTLI